MQDQIPERKGEVVLSPEEKLKKIRELCSEGIFIDGAHHKQWYLTQIGEVGGVDIEIEPDDFGIAP